MTEEKISEANQLASDRNVMALERTLLAWLRTAISMISFGFTIYKFFDEMTVNDAGQKGLFTPRAVGMVMISFGLLALSLAQIQHHLAMKQLKLKYPAVQKSFSSILSFLVLTFGLLLFFGVLFRQ